MHADPKVRVFEILHEEFPTLPVYHRATSAAKAKNKVADALREAFSMKDKDIYSKLKCKRRPDLDDVPFVSGCGKDGLKVRE